MHGTMCLKKQKTVSTFWTLCLQMWSYDIFLCFRWVQPDKQFSGRTWDAVFRHRAVQEPRAPGIDCRGGDKETVPHCGYWFCSSLLLYVPITRNYTRQAACLLLPLRCTSLSLFRGQRHCMLRLCQKHTEVNSQRRQSCLRKVLLLWWKEKSCYFSGLLNVDLSKAVFLSVVSQNCFILIRVLGKTILDSLYSNSWCENVNWHQVTQRDFLFDNHEW